MKKNIFFASLKSLKKGVGAGSGSVSQRYGSEGSAPKCHGSPPLVSKGASGLSHGGVLLPDPEDGVEEEDGVGGGGGLGHPSPEGRVHGSAGIAAPSTTVVVDKR